MPSHPVEMSQRKIAMVAGLAFVVMTLASVFGIFFVLKKLIVAGDAPATANAVMASEMLFRAGLCSLIVVLVCDVVAAWALYLFLKPVSGSLSLLAMLFRLVYAALLGAALFNLAMALRCLREAASSATFEARQLQAQALLLVNAFFDGWAVGLLVFGAHLLVLGWLIYKSGYIPKFLGVLIFIGALGYLIQNCAVFLLPDFEEKQELFEMILGLPMAVGELSFACWLLLKGGRRQTG